MHSAPTEAAGAPRQDPAAAPPTRRAAAIRELLVGCVYLGLAVWATWPLAGSLGTALPTGTEPVATVPLLNAWTIWWNVDRAGDVFRGYWDAPIFHPTAGSFGLSEAQPTAVLMAPVTWATKTPVPAYNVYLLLSLALNGWSGWRLSRRLGLGGTAALAGGAMVEMLPIVHWQLGVLQLVPLFGTIWTIHALLDLGQRPGFGPAVRLGGSFALTYALCHHHGLFVSVLLIVAGGWLLLPQALNWRTWVSLVPAAGLCVLLVAPVVVVQLRLKEELQSDFVRDTDWQRSLSAWAVDYTIPPWPQLLPISSLGVPERQYWCLSPGYAKMLLAVVGCASGLAIRRLRVWTLFLATFVGASVVLSLGPDFSVRGWSPFQALVEHYPGFSQIRNVFRFAYFAQLGIALFAAAGIHAVASLLRPPLRWLLARATPRHAGLLAAAAASFVALAVGAVATFEVRPARQPLYFPPRLEDNYGWTDWLRLHTPPDAVIACVPFPPGTDVRDYLDQTIWMHWQTVHGRRMANGYSGFFPKPFMELTAAMEYFPDETSLELLDGVGVTYIIVRRAVLPWETIRAYKILAEQLQWVYGDDRAGIDIYKLEL